MVGRDGRFALRRRNYLELPTKRRESIRCGVYFLLCVRSFGGNEDAAHCYERQAEFHKRGQRRKRAGRGGVVDLPVLWVMGQVLGAAMDGTGIRQFKAGDDVLKELSLLAGGLQQRDVQPRKGDGERKAGKAAAGSNVDEPRAVRGRQCGGAPQAFEKQTRLNLIRVFDSGQVGAGRVPCQQLVSIDRECVKLLLAQWRAEPPGPLLQQGHGCRCVYLAGRVIRTHVHNGSIGAVTHAAKGGGCMVWANKVT